MASTVIRKLQKALSEAGTFLRQGDVLGFLMVLSRVFPPSLVRVHGVVLTRSSSDLKLPPLPNRHRVVCRALRASEVPAVSSLPHHEWKSPTQLQVAFQDHLAEGAEGFVAEIDGRIVAYSWVAYGRYHIPEVEFEGRLQPDEACTFDVYVEPMYRYTEVYVALVRFLAAAMHERGIKSFVGYGDHTNRYSIGIHRRLGYTVIGSVEMVRFPFGSLWSHQLAREGRRWRWKWGRPTIASSTPTNGDRASASCRHVTVDTLEDSTAVIEKLAPEWRGLCKEPFYGPDWILPYIRTFVPDGRVVAITVRDQGRLRALLPLLKERTWFYGLPIRKLRNPGNEHFPRFDLVSASDSQPDAYVQEIWQHLKRSPDWDMLEARDVPAGGAFERLVELARCDGYSIGNWESLQTPYISLDRWKGGTDWWLQRRRMNFRHTVRRNVRKLHAQDGLVLRRIDVAEPAALNRFYLLEKSGWKGKQGSAIACSESTRVFYDMIASAAAQTGNFVLYFLEWKGQTLAAHFGLEHRARYFILKTAYNENLRQYGPGHLIVKEVLEDCLRRGIIEFDFTGPLAEWKKDWTSEIRPHAWHYIFNKSPMGRAAHLLKFRVRPIMRKWLRASEELGSDSAGESPRKGGVSAKP